MEERTFTTVVEHIACFQIKPEARAPQIESLVAALKALERAPGVLQLNVGPLTESTAGQWDYALYSRHPTRSALRKFLASADLAECRSTHFEACCEEVYQVTFDSQVPCGLAAPNIKAVHFSLFSLKPGMESLSAETIVRDLPSLVGAIEGIQQIGLGRLSAQVPPGEEAAHSFQWAFVLTAETGPGLLKGIQSEKVIEWKDSLAPFMGERVVVDFVPV